MNAYHKLTVFFGENLRKQEIWFCKPPPVRFENTPEGSCLYVNGLPYVRFLVPIQGLG